jgi:hypothetical protein
MLHFQYGKAAIAIPHRTEIRRSPAHEFGIAIGVPVANDFEDVVRGLDVGVEFDAVGVARVAAEEAFGGFDGDGGVVREDFGELSSMVWVEDSTLILAAMITSLLLSWNECWNLEPLVRESLMLMVDAIVFTFERNMDSFPII